MVELFCVVLSGGPFAYTTYENGKQSGKHLWFEWAIALIIYTRLILMPWLLALKNVSVPLNSEQMRALNHVRIVVMEILVYDMRPRVCVICFGWSHGKGIYGLISHYILLLHY